VPGLSDLPLAAPRALRAATGFLDRLPEIEGAIAGAASRAQATLDELLDRVRPIEQELEDLRESAQRLERQLAETEGQFNSTERRIAQLDETASELAAVAARLEGSLEHLLERVPGLSLPKAVKRGREVAAAATEDTSGD
jgi:chromosome segregation ATPase